MQPPSLGWTIAGAATGTTDPLAVMNQQASLTADYIPIQSAALDGTYAINIANLLGINSQVASLNDPQTFTNKGLTAPNIANPVFSGTATGTYALSGTPTINSPTINTPTISGGTLAMDVIAGKTVSNSLTLAGISIASGVITQANSIAAGTIVQNGVGASQLATNAITLGFTKYVGGTQSTTSTTFVPITGLTVTVTVPAGGRNVEIDVRGLILGSIGGDGVAVALYKDGAYYDQQSWDSFGANYFTAWPMIFFDTPSAGSHTYAVYFCTSTSAQTISIQSGNNSSTPFSNPPSYIWVKAV